MKDQAENQMKEFSLSQAKDCIKSLNSGEYDKMIFNEGNALKRTNYLFVKAPSAPLHQSLTPIPQTKLDELWFLTWRAVMLIV